MLLSDVFEQLSYGELSQLAIGGAADGGIQQENYPSILAHVNFASTELHKRFKLQEQEEEITLVSGTNEYDITDVFTGRLLEISSVKIIDADGEDQYCTFTDKDSDYYLERPSFNKLIVTNELISLYDSIFVTIQKDHVKLNPDNIDLDTTQLELPLVLLDPLVNFIAARAFMSLDGDNNIQRSDKYMQLYEVACQRVEGSKILEQTSIPQSKLEANGWV